MNFWEHFNNHNDFDTDANFDFEHSDNEQLIDFGLTNIEDHIILMHRDAHFNGDFNVMLDYYRKEGLGVSDDIEIARVEYLQKCEISLGKNLSTVVLFGSEIEQIAKTKMAYQALQEVYEGDKDNKLRLIADLILTEDDKAESEIEAILANNENLGEELIKIIQSDFFYCDLAPGYGFAPKFAAVCLGKLKYKPAIMFLFDMLVEPLIFDDFVILEALRNIGDASKQFLLKAVQQKPISQKNEHAMYVLSIFSNDRDVIEQCISLLNNYEQIKENSLFIEYVLACLSDCSYKDLTEKIVNFTKQDFLPMKIRNSLKKLLQHCK